MSYLHIVNCLLSAVSLRFGQSRFVPGCSIVATITWDLNITGEMCPICRYTPAEFVDDHLMMANW